MAGFDAVTEQLLAGLEMCLTTALNARPNAPATVCTVPGEGFQLMLSAGVLENVCCDGYAAVRLAGVSPRYDTAAEFVSPCGIQRWRVDLEMGVARCAPTGDVNAGPSCPEWRAAAALTQSDLGAMLEAVCCFQGLAVVGGAENTSVTAWVPFGPEGGCLGGIMGVSVLVGACQCPEQEV